MVATTDLLQKYRRTDLKVMAIVRSPQDEAEGRNNDGEVLLRNWQIDIGDDLAKAFVFRFLLSATFDLHLPTRRTS